MVTKRELQSEKLQQVRDLAEADLYIFAKLVNPSYEYGDIHKEVFKWLQAENSEFNQLLLLPRAHLKSHCMAVWSAWWVTKHPDTTILYISATSTLAEDQLYAIKGMLDSDTYARYWPEMVNPEEGKREKWASTSIMVDHPTRKREGVRDATIRTAGITTNTTGWHADVIVPDDVVVPDNAYTEDGRQKVSRALSQISSIKNPGGFVKACGTRYHPSDQYDVWMNMKEFVYNDEDDIVDEKPVWQIFERVVEKEGAFLWPRSVRSDGKAFGFDRKVLSRIKAEYTDTAQYFAQYYNNPNDPSSDRIDRSRFQHYDQKHIKYERGQWFFKDRILNVYASIDFAFTISKKSDFTAIVVIGVDKEGYIYVLDIDRFKADRISEIFEHVLTMHDKWNFSKLRAEVNAAQGIVARDLKDRIRQEGMRLSIDEHTPSRHQGNKEERIAAVLEPRYDNQSIWHYRGGYMPILEEELVLARPPHDDIKDALASAVEIAKSPRHARSKRQRDNVVYDKRFGGISH